MVGEGAGVLHITRMYGHRAGRPLGQEPSGKGNLSFNYLKGPLIANISNRNTLWLCHLETSPLFRRLYHNPPTYYAIM